MVGFDEPGTTTRCSHGDTNVLQLFVTSPTRSGRFSGSTTSTSITPILADTRGRLHLRSVAGGGRPGAGGVPLRFNGRPSRPATRFTRTAGIDIADLSDRPRGSTEATTGTLEPAQPWRPRHVGPFQPPAIRQAGLIFLQSSRGNNGFVSLGIVRFMVCPGFLGRELAADRGRHRLCRTTRSFLRFRASRQLQHGRAHGPARRSSTPSVARGAVRCA